MSWFHDESLAKRKGLAKFFLTFASYALFVLPITMLVSLLLWSASGDIAEQRAKQGRSIDYCALDEAVDDDCYGLQGKVRDHCVAHAANGAVRLKDGILPECREAMKPPKDEGR